MTNLLDPRDVRELEALRRRLVLRVRSGGAGERSARRRGASAEFLEHRAYAPGDDLRRVDWLAFARSGEAVFKLFRAEEDGVVRVVVDASASLDFGDPPKILAAKRIAAAIGYVALAGSERAEVVTASSRAIASSDTLRGRAKVAALVRALDRVTAAGATDLAAALDAVVRRASRPGMLVVLSDFFDPGSWDRAVRRARAAGHDVILVQVLADEEINPPWTGDVALADAETGATVDVTIDDRAIRAYRARLDALFAALRKLAKEQGAAYVRTTTSAPIVDAVRRVVLRATD